MRSSTSAGISWLRPAALALALGAGSVLARAQDGASRVSEFGRYEGWSEELFDGWATSSVYVEMRDGVRLAVDVTRPTFYGELVLERLPVVWTHSRYHRRPLVHNGAGLRYVTEGVLRASHRALGQAPWNNMGLPYQRGYHDDVAALPVDEATELVFDLHPTANVFDAGHRIRVTLMGADADNALALATAGETTLRVFRDAAHPSAIELPLLDGRPPGH